MRKNGFTLVELLITITLITIISIAAGVGINEMFQRQNEKNYENFIKTINDAACTHAIINNIQENSSVSINDLIEEGLLSKKLENPITKENIEIIGDLDVIISVVDGEMICSLE